ncbi:hypothetical protein EDB84DRAFT_901765 [Lactarius hengduanensis]|nr:hypothetical protein EDB84DRAFT_901765 [Lactarius hengduanensis]
MWAVPWKGFRVQPLFFYACTLRTQHLDTCTLSGNFAVEIGSDRPYFVKCFTGRHRLPGRTFGRLSVLCIPTGHPRGGTVAATRHGYMTRLHDTDKPWVEEITVEHFAVVMTDAHAVCTVLGWLLPGLVTCWYHTILISLAGL